MKKHFSDVQLTTATKSQYKLYTHIHRLRETIFTVVQHMSKAKYVITYVTILFHTYIVYMKLCFQLYSI